MMSRLEVLGRMLVLRRIAAAHMATDEAPTQMDPRIAHRLALLTSTALSRNGAQIIEVCADHGFLSPFSKDEAALKKVAHIGWRHNPIIDGKALQRLPETTTPMAMS
jgi:hypothetical protein